MDARQKAINEADHTLCRMIGDVCMGYHCAYCGVGCGEQGHDCTERKKATQEKDAIAKRIKENL